MVGRRSQVVSDSITPEFARSRPRSLAVKRCATYLSTGGSAGSTDLDLSRRFPEFLGVFAPSSTPLWPPTSGEEATPPIASASDRVTAAGSVEDDGSGEP